MKTKPIGLALMVMTSVFLSFVIASCLGFIGSPKAKGEAFTRFKVETFYDRYNLITDTKTGREYLCYAMNGAAIIELKEGAK